jgi:hypothetical protein
VTICSSVNRVFIGSLSGPRAPFSQASAGPKIAGQVNRFEDYDDELERTERLE